MNRNFIGKFIIYTAKPIQDMSLILTLLLGSCPMYHKQTYINTLFFSNSLNQIMLTYLLTYFFTSQKLALTTTSWLLVVFSLKRNLLFIFLGNTLLGQSCSLKSFLRTLILRTWISVDLLSTPELIWNSIILL